MWFVGNMIQEHVEGREGGWENYEKIVTLGIGGKGHTTGM